MKMGADCINNTRNMFMVGPSLFVISQSYTPIQSIPGKISISLDCWTSSNNYSFIAIIAHFVNVQGNLGMCSCNLSLLPVTYGLIEEVLIDFHELLGSHTGENIADVVWETLEMYGIEQCVMEFYKNVMMLLTY